MADQNRTKSPRSHHESVRSDKQVYALAHTALMFAMAKTNASIRSLAKWTQVNPTTARDWVNATRPVNVLKLMRSRRLSRYFVACLHAEDRRDRHDARQ